MWHLYKDLMRFVQHMGPDEYLLLVALALGVGLVCLRGFGSRSSY